MKVEILIVIACGILVVGGIATIVLWQRNRSMTYGWLAFAASAAVVFGLVLYSPIPHHEPVKSSICITRMNTLAKAMMMYAGDCDNKLPHTDWSDTFTGYVDDLDLACPESNATVAYSMNANVLGKDIYAVPDPFKLVVCFESELGPNSLGGEGNVAWRHKGSAFFLFADGHVSRFTPERLPEIRWK